MKFRHILVTDLETTCCNQDRIPRAEMEVIEIGAVAVSTDTLQPLAEFSTFVRPTRRANLTPYCTELTSIRQEDVDSADELPEAMDAFAQWSRQFEDLVFASWGAFDYNVLSRECRVHGIAYPFNHHLLDLMSRFARSIGSRSMVGLDAALGLQGLTFDGRRHRAIDDARNTAKLLPQTLGRSREAG